MRICMLSHDFPPNIGGIASHVYELSKALVAKGHEVHILTSRKSLDYEAQEERDGLLIHRSIFPDLRLVGTAVSCTILWKRLHHLIGDFDFDILHSHNMFPDSFAILTVSNVPKVITEHSSVFVKSVRKNRFIRTKYLLLRQADHIIAPSEEIAGYVEMVGIDPKRISFVSNGVDVARFSPDKNGHEVRKQFGIDDEKVIICPRRLEKKNGVEFLIDSIPSVISEYSDVYFMIVGDGSEYDGLRERVKRLNVENHVIFAGRVENSKMPEFYAASDIAVLPSLVEATSISGLEALSSGVPLIGTEVGGIPCLIESGKNGILIPPRFPNEISRAVLKLLKDDDMRGRMALNARQRAVEQFSWVNIANRVVGIYQKSIEESALGD